MPDRRSTKTVAHNLPLQLTTFVGRTQEKSGVKRLLSSSRLLTLMGAGGAGKTRLALEVASEAREQFPDGVWLVERGPLSDPVLVARTAATAVGVADQGEKPVLVALVESLRSRRLLLVLDKLGFSSRAQIAAWAVERAHRGT